MSHDSSQDGYKLILVPDDDTERLDAGRVYVRWDTDEGRVLAGPFDVIADVAPDRQLRMSRLLYEQIEVIG